MVVDGEKGGNRRWLQGALSASAELHFSPLCLTHRLEEMASLMCKVVF